MPGQPQPVRRAGRGQTGQTPQKWQAKGAPAFCEEGLLCAPSPTPGDSLSELSLLQGALAAAPVSLAFPPGGPQQKGTGRVQTAVPAASGAQAGLLDREGSQGA